MAGFLNALNHPQYITGSVNQANEFSVTGQGQRNYFIPSASNFHDARGELPLAMHVQPEAGVLN